jgi:hypothetical protein
MDSTSSESHLLSGARQATFTAYSEEGQAARTATVTHLVDTEIVPGEGITMIIASLSPDDWERLKLDESLSQDDWKAVQDVEYESVNLGDGVVVDMSTINKDHHVIYVDEWSGL